MAKLIFTGAALLSVALNCTPAAAAGGCTVYEHRDLKGAKFNLSHAESMQMGGEEIGSNFRTYYYVPRWNDKISSFKVSSGCTITLWQHVGAYSGAGPRYVRSGKIVWYMGSAWNDQASWVDCSCG